MDARNSAGLVFDFTEDEARSFFDTAQRQGISKLPNPKAQDTITATLAGSNTCTAAGMSASGSTPVLDLCRKLIEAGFDHRLPLHAYRRDVLCLTVRSIGEGAALAVNGKGTGFMRYREAVGIAPPIAPLDEQATTLANGGAK